MADDEMDVCPFNPVHIIIKHRMPYHIVKCQKSYTGEKLVVCHFNAMHWVPPQKMREHLEECEEYRVATMDHQRKVVDKVTKELVEKRTLMSKTNKTNSKLGSTLKDNKNETL